jgi:hypothetical protein
MEVELRLKQLLREYHLDEHGVEKDMANKCGLHRHTIAKLLKNASPNPSLPVLGKISRYLIARGIPSDILPGALLGGRPAGLWKAIGALDNVAIYLGMYKHIKNNNQPGPGHMTIALHDAAAASKIREQLSMKAETGDSRPIVHWRYVPFQVRPASQKVAGDWFEEDKDNAKEMFKKMKTSGDHESSILLGSQRANYLVEYLVAELFGCKPFYPNTNKEPRVPFYLSYRNFDRPVPSCFGGRDLPPGLDAPKKSGVWFINDKTDWQLYEWKRNKCGSGIVMTIRDSGSVVMALFGFSGRSTNAICNEIIKNPKVFWAAQSENPKSAEDNGNGKSSGRKSYARKKEFKNIVIRQSKEIGIYICRVSFYQADGGMKTWKEENYEKDEVKVTPLSKKVLEDFLPKKAANIGK